MSPSAFWFVSFNVTLPPFEPLFPHFAAPIFRKSPVLSLFTISLFSRLITVLVLVTKIISPLLLIIFEFFFLNYEVPTSASPLID